MDFEEFLGLLNKSRKFDDSDLKEIFGIFDKSGTGDISALELQNFAILLGEKLSI